MLLTKMLNNTGKINKIKINKIEESSAHKSCAGIKNNVDVEYFLLLLIGFSWVHLYMFDNMLLNHALSS